MFILSLRVSVSGACCSALCSALRYTVALQCLACSAPMRTRGVSLPTAVSSWLRTPLTASEPPVPPRRKTMYQLKRWRLTWYRVCQFPSPLDVHLSDPIHVRQWSWPLERWISFYKLWKTKFFVQFEIIIDILVGSFWFIWIPMLCVYGHYK